MWRTRLAATRRTEALLIRAGGCSHVLPRNRSQLTSSFPPQSQKQSPPIGNSAGRFLCFGNHLSCCTRDCRARKQTTVVGMKFQPIEVSWSQGGLLVREGASVWFHGFRNKPPNWLGSVIVQCSCSRGFSFNERPTATECLLLVDRVPESGIKRVVQGEKFQMTTIRQSFQKPCMRLKIKASLFRVETQHSFVVIELFKENLVNNMIQIAYSFQKRIAPRKNNRKSQLSKNNDFPFIPQNW